jgi:hypothetical protein
MGEVRRSRRSDRGGTVGKQRPLTPSCRPARNTPPSSSRVEVGSPFPVDLPSLAGSRLSASYYGRVLTWSPSSGRSPRVLGSSRSSTPNLRTCSSSRATVRSAWIGMLLVEERGGLLLVGPGGRARAGCSAAAALGWSPRVCRTRAASAGVGVGSRCAAQWAWRSRYFVAVSRRARRGCCARARSRWVRGGGPAGLLGVVLEEAGDSSLVGKGSCRVDSASSGAWRSGGSCSVGAGRCVRATTRGSRPAARARAPGTPRGSTSCRGWERVGK